jgi:hypothetical protein
MHLLVVVAVEEGHSIRVAIAFLTKPDAALFPVPFDGGHGFDLGEQLIQLGDFVFHGEAILG